MTAHPIHELSQADYARHRKVTAKAIEKAIASGRIPADAVRRVGRSKLIDVAAADVALGQPSARVNTPIVDDEGAMIGGGGPQGVAAAPRETPALTRARTRQAEISARMAELEFAKRLGQVVNVDDVIRSMARCAETLVRDIEQLPSRADDLATACNRGGAVAVRALLKEIARDIRRTIEANMRLLEAEEPEYVDVDDNGDEPSPPSEASDQVSA